MSAYGLVDGFHRFFMSCVYEESFMRRTSSASLVGFAAVILLWGGAEVSSQAPRIEKKISTGKVFELRLIRVGIMFHGLRFNSDTGAAWILSADRFEKIEEAAPLPLGSYEVTLAADDHDWTALRIDRLTGNTWHLKNRRWLAVKEAE
jgi:hypothetical protein